jgi:dihydroorotate dehydrogenase (fumarate)
MNLTTHYLGLKLSGPVILGASPMVDDVDYVKMIEDAGGSAIVMHSIFQEQIEGAPVSDIYAREIYGGAAMDESSEFPKPSDYKLDKDTYLDQIAAIKKNVKIPCIASLNGYQPGPWTEFARFVEQAGADALELNTYHIPTDPRETSDAVENRILAAVDAVRKTTKLPIAIKLSPYISSMANFATRLEGLGINGLTLFNRFYQSDMDIETLQPVPSIRMSDSSELLLRIHWLAILSHHVDLSFAISGGVHTEIDAIKAIMSGANAVQTVSSVMLNGPKHIKTMLDGVAEWMKRHGYASIEQMHSSLNLSWCADQSAFERGNYVKTLQSYGS